MINPILKNIIDALESDVGKLPSHDFQMVIGDKVDAFDFSNIPNEDEEEWDLVNDFREDNIVYILSLFGKRDDLKIIFLIELLNHLGYRFSNSLISIVFDRCVDIVSKKRSLMVKILKEANMNDIM